MLRKVFLTILMIIELSIPNIVSELIEKKVLCHPDTNIYFFRSPL